MARVVFVIFACVFVALAVYLYTDLPKDVADPWKVRQVVAVKRFVALVAGLSDLFHVSSYINATRSLNLWTLATRVDTRVKVTEVTFAGVSVRIYRPIDAKQDEKLPALVYIPGGGWMYNHIDLYDGLASYLAAEAGVAVVSIQYRSAPERIFPVAFDDCVTAIVYFLRKAHKYGVDSTRISLAGDDSGGNLVAAVANRLSFETVLPPIKFHALFYPLLQAFDFRLPSFAAPETGFTASTSEVIVNWLNYFQGHSGDADEYAVNKHTDALMKASEYAAYVSTALLPPEYQPNNASTVPGVEGNITLAENFERALMNPYFCPLMSTEFTALTPAFVLTTGYDCARDDGLLYIQRLRAANLTVVHKHYAQAGRGFWQTVGGMWEQELAREAVDDFVKFVRANL